MNARGVTMGPRGEGWVVAQAVLFALILVAPFFFPDLFIVPLWLKIAGVLLILAGGALGLLGLLGLGRNLSPFPKPVEGGQLVTSGAYGLVRHPIYTGLVLGAFGWAAWNGSPPAALLALALFFFFDLKSRREERWLRETYPDYPAYARRVKKLIPWLY